MPSATQPHRDPQTILLASTNSAKLGELRRLCAGLLARVLSPADAGFPLPEVIEDGVTFRDNAVKKATAAARAAARAGIDLWVLADDSGLVVDALDGEPGVHSARYAGVPGSREVKDAANNALLLHCLTGVPEAARTARFVCAIALARAGEILFTTEASVDGRILDAPRGSGGFGYDPLFWHEPSQASFGELPAARKHAVSHRGRAMQELRRFLERRLATEET